MDVAQVRYSRRRMRYLTRKRATGTIDQTFKLVIINRIIFINCGREIMKSKHLISAVAVIVAFASLPARADTVSVQWFTVAPGTPDFGTNQCCSTFF